MRIAVLADIHGNLPALEAVIEDLAAQGPDLVILAGDQVNRCPWSNEVLDLVGDMGWPAIAGNHELVLTRLGTPELPARYCCRPQFPDLWWTRERFTRQHLDTIAHLPQARTFQLEGGPPIRMVHGVPDNPLEGFSAGQRDEEIVKLLQAVPEPVVIGAHTHRPHLRQIGGRSVYNPGSVGMPYNDDPRAQYMLLDGDGRDWRPTFRAVVYPIEWVCRGFQTSGLMKACGPVGRLYLRTIETGQPWVSDFLIWLRSQPASVSNHMDRAVGSYLAHHGPGKWAFSAE